MYSIKNKSRKKFVLLVCGIILLALIVLMFFRRHSDSEKFSIDATKAKYIVTLSKRHQEKGVLLLFDDKGQMHTKKRFPGCDIISSVKKNNNYYFYSMRQNKHWKLHGGKSFTAFSLMKKKYARYDYESMPVWFATGTSGDIIEAMNIGGINGKYLSNIIYTYKGKRRETVIEEQNLTAAIRYKSRIYVQGYDSNYNKNFITAVNCKNGKGVKLGLKNSFAAQGSRLLKLGDRIVTYGDNSGNALKKGNKAAIAIIDTRNNRILGEKLLKGKEVLFGFTCKGRIKLIDYDGILHEYDKNLREKAIRNISKKEIYINNSSEEYLIEDMNIIEKTGNIYVFRMHSKLDNKLVGYIDKYRKSDLKLLQSVKISLPDEKDWMGENSCFYVNGD